MSLILEALRKSEAERRRGHTPDLLSETTPAAPAARVASRDAGTLVAVAVAALVTLVLVAWWLRSAAEPDQAVARASVAVSASSAAVTSSTSVPAPATPPVRAAVSSPAPAAPSPAPLTRPTTATATALPAQTPPAPVATGAAADIATSPTSALPVPPPEQVASVEPPPVQPVFASEDVPLRISDLPSEDRQQLPALKVSMHMWASEATNRFAIIDGARVNEGSRVGQATVEAIEQDAVVLSWRGRRIRLPIR